MRGVWYVTNVKCHLTPKGVTTHSSDLMHDIKHALLFLQSLLSSGLPTGSQNCSEGFNDLRSYCAVKADIELTDILLSQPPKYEIIGFLFVIWITFFGVYGL